jgi:MFS family permease
MCEFLNPSEKLLAAARSPVLTQNTTTFTKLKNGNVTKRFQYNNLRLKEILMDWKLWIISVSMLFIISLLDFLVLLSTEICMDSFQIGAECVDECTSEQLLHRTLGQSVPLELIILCLAPYVIGLASSIHLAIQSDRDGERIIYTLAPLFVSLVGFFFLSSITDPTYQARYLLGLVPAVSGLIAAVPNLLAWAIEHISDETQRSSSAIISTILGNSLGMVITSLIHKIVPSKYVSQPFKCLAAFSMNLLIVLILLLCKHYRLDKDTSRTRAPGLRRLLDDADEARAWNIELTDIEYLRQKTNHVNYDSMGNPLENGEEI